MSDQSINGGFLAPVQTMPLWQWDTTGTVPVVSGYPTAFNNDGSSIFSPTKTGLTATDLQNFVGVPLVYYGNPPAPVFPNTILQWLRWAEDMVEQETTILLCQTWVASPPTQTQSITSQCGLLTVSGYQIQGLDYDLADTAYDFMFKNAQDEGWMCQSLRYRPVQSVSYNPSNYTAIKNTSYVYPLLNQFFRIPPSWNVEDRDYGLVRYVPAQNVQMLPLFAMQLSFMGFAETVPGAIYFQYTAGLTPFDYQGRYSFMKQLVLCRAAVIALSAIQGTINLGASQIDTMVDGLRQQLKYSEKGPYSGLIANWERQSEMYMTMARSKVGGGPFVTML